MQNYHNDPSQNKFINYNPANFIPVELSKFPSVFSANTGNYFVSLEKILCNNSMPQLHQNWYAKMYVLFMYTEPF